MAQEYYILKPAVDTPETGNAYPAAESYDDYDFKGPHSVHKLNFREFPDFAPDIRFKLAKGAKLTDMLSQAAISAHGFLISPRLKEAFEQFKIVPHQYYPATIEDHQGNLHQYFWMHLVWEIGKEFIDYNNSIFFKRKFSKNLGCLKINSDEEIKTLLEEFNGRFMIGFEAIKLIELPPFELFPVPYNIDIVMNYSGIAFTLPSYLHIPS